MFGFYVSGHVYPGFGLVMAHFAQRKSGGSFGHKLKSGICNDSKTAMPFNMPGKVVFGPENPVAKFARIFMENVTGLHVTSDASQNRTRVLANLALVTTIAVFENVLLHYSSCN